MSTIDPGNEAAASSEPILSVFQLTTLIKDVLEGTFPPVWVSGEVSDFSQSHAGHMYFTLKDSQAQIKTVLWRNTASRIRFKMEDGLEVLCHGSLDVYPPRGTYQLVVRSIEPRGQGALQLAFRQLHAKLAAEGLFDNHHKKPLPKFPRRIAIVTSPTGAAVRDFLEVVRRRWRGVHVLVIPARVQGEGAAKEIAAGIASANQLVDPPDVLIVARGGGSAEDLWCFNEEIVVRAIFASRIPVVSAVGHEIDVTLSDFVADVRALTPTEAAERVVPSSEELQGALGHLGQRLRSALLRKAVMARTRLDALAQRRIFRRPFEQLHDLSRYVDELDERMKRGVELRHARTQEQLTALANQLESLSPLAVLGRGYSVTQLATDGQVVRDANSLHEGDRIVTRLSQGQVISRVDKVLPRQES